MKKSFRFVLILSVLFGIGSVGIVSNSFAYSTDGKIALVEGSGATAADPVRVYMLVHNPEQGANTAGLTAGDVVIFDLVSDDGVSINLTGVGGQVAVSTDAVAGVVISANIPTQDAADNTAVQDIGRRNWGYIQTYGLCTLTNIHIGTADPSCTAGDGLRASGTARTASCVNATTPTGAYPSLGFIYDTVSSSGPSKDTFIRTR